MLCYGRPGRLQHNQYLDCTVLDLKYFNSCKHLLFFLSNYLQLHTSIEETGNNLKKLKLELCFLMDFQVRHLS